MNPCACGCGDRTKTREGRYLPGHHRRRFDHYDVIDCGHETPCWVWRLARNPKGYGRVRVPNENRKVLAHRFYWERANGPVPSGMQLDHLCRNPSCCNPDHLEAVPAHVNTWRGRAARLTPDSVRELRRLAADGVPTRELAMRFSTSPGNVRKIATGQSWRAA